MKLSKFDLHFERTINELQLIHVRANVLNSFITQTKLRIEADTRVGHELITGGLPFRDLTLAKGTNNLFLPANYYRLNRTNLNDEIELIVSRECLFYIAQAYEILESYLYDQVSEFIIQQSSFQMFVDGKSNRSTVSSVRRSLKMLDDRKNNRHLVRILRANSVVYAIHEKNNIYDRDFHEWFEMLGGIRNCITHMRMELTNDMLNAIPSNLYKLYFQSRPRDNKQLLFIEYDRCSELMSNIADYIFLVYKSVVETCGGDMVTFETIYPFFSYHQTVGFLDPLNDN